MLVEKLQRFVEGEPHEPSQVTAALGLLRFQLPQLTAVDLAAKVDGELKINLVQYQEKKKGG